MVYGRIQPIIATLATGAIYIGIALFLRPTPGGKVDEDLSWAMTNDLKEFAGSFHFADDGAAAWFQPFAWLPVPFVVAVLVVLIVWVPFRTSVTGRGVYAVGSSEGAAYMSGLQRSSAASSPPSRWPASSPASAASTSPSRPPPATPTCRRPAPTR